MSAFQEISNYKNIIMTPELDPGFVNNFVLPQLTAENPTVFSVASGRASIYEALKKASPDIKRFIGLDLGMPPAVLEERMQAMSAGKIDLDSGDASRAAMENGIRRSDGNLFVIGDVRNFHLTGGDIGADLGLGINALIYEMRDMLRALYEALKPGGKAIVNYTLPLDVNNRLFDFLASLGATVSHQDDYITVNCTTVTDKRFLNTKHLGVQQQPCSTDVVEGVAKSVGFSSFTEIGEHGLVVPFNDFLKDDERKKYGSPDLTDKPLVNKQRVALIQK